MFGMVGPVTVNVAGWILMAISYERYCGIKKPFDFHLNVKVGVCLNVLFYAIVFLYIYLMHKKGVPHQRNFLEGE